MSISRTTFLSKPLLGERILPETLAYLRSRAKREAYDLVIREFKKSGITKAELSRRLGKGAPEISRMLGGPANWTITTVADLLFAISSGIPKWDIAFPLDRVRRNDTRPDWVDSDETPLDRVVSEGRRFNNERLNDFGLPSLASDNPNKPQNPIQERLGL